MKSVQENDTVLVALSGGVDSAAAAVQLCQSGKKVIGVYILNSAQQEHEADDAKEIASRLGFELILFDAADKFEIIKDEFAAAYAAGRTPNPCVRCNQLIKFGSLFDLADSIGADYLATGHYARISRTGESNSIVRAKALGKDQSYVLFGVRRECLGRILFPNGQLQSKAAAREIVKEAGLEIHNRAESQDICFVPDGDYTGILRDRAKEALTPGAILDCNGRKLGEHNGYGLFTIGQRRGLRVAAGKPVYVCNINAAEASVTLGPKEALFSTGLRASKANWLRDVPKTFDCGAQVRYGHKTTKARVQLLEKNEFQVDFVEPVFAVTPGQAAVLYDDDVLLGGGCIEYAVKDGTDAGTI